MTDVELRIAIAKEVFGYGDLKVSAAGDLVVRSAGPSFIVAAPITLLKWTSFLHAAAQLEDRIRELQLWPAYVSRLRDLLGKEDVSMASARQRAEAVLATVRENRKSA